MLRTPWLTRIEQEGSRQSRNHDLAPGVHLIKGWAKLQNIMATSSTEPEVYAGNRATESVEVQAFAEDLGRAVPIRLRIDSSAALSTKSRTGLGKANSKILQAIMHDYHKISPVTDSEVFESAGSSIKEVKAQLRQPRHVKSWVRISRGTEPLNISYDIYS